MDLVFARIRRALMLDPGAFEEARDDSAFTPYALVAAALAALLGGIGAFLWASVILDETDDFFLEATVLGTIFLIVLWGIGILGAYLVLTQLYRETIAPDALLRVAALGHIPFALSLLVFVPGLGFAFGVLAIASMFFYTNFGIRAAWPDLEAFRVMVAVLAAFSVWLMVLPLFTGPSDQFVPGTFVFEWSEDAIQDVAGAFNDFQSPGLE
jgi:hypothetical protein